MQATPPAAAARGQIDGDRRRVFLSGVPVPSGHRGRGASAPSGDVAMVEDDGRPSSVRTVRHTRRLSDKILTAFHQACDQGNFEVATELLAVLEFMTRRHQDGKERRARESLVAAHERLWLLRHREKQYSD
jgi:hypothetical protein